MSETTVITTTTTSNPIEGLTVDDISKSREEMSIREQLILNKALSSNNVNEIMKAQNFIKQRQQSESKSLLVDPLQLSASFGYKDKPFSLSYDVLRGMAKTHIIKAIVETRKDQVSTFCTPQTDKYSTGFVIQKKAKYRVGQEQKKLTKAEEQRIDDITEFLLGCGNTENYWHADTFDTFISKVVGDSLVLDQGTFECVRNRGGQLIEFFATDGGTYRVADSWDSDLKPKEEEIVKGYSPTHVQVYQGKIHAEFYPWELCFGVRNPQTDIRNIGYGRSELEDMVQTVTAILNSDLYNSNFFKVGSSPKGILKYSGNINQNTVEEFRRQWINQVSGVANMHKIPIINADKLDFINTMVNNKDMEFAKYQEFLIKISCALYKIDPSEIGFPMSGSSDAKPMFEGNNEARLKYSRDKGLKPLLKKIEFWLNKWIVWQLDNTFEFRFVGIEEEHDEKTDLEQDIQRLSNFQTVNEIRAKWNLKDIEGGDTILNPTFVSSKQQAMMGNQGANDMMGGMFGSQEGGDDDNPFTGQANEGGGKKEGKEKPDQEGGEDNPFMKALEIEIPRIFR